MGSLVVHSRHPIVSGAKVEKEEIRAESRRERSGSERKEVRNVI